MDQAEIFETATARSLLGQLIDESRLYRTGKDYKDLLDFVGRLRGFAPFNALLLHVQKPGLRYAASARDWRERFGRLVRPRARPLLILRLFGPVALVYDLQDTEGRPVPEDAATFVVHGCISADKMVRAYRHLAARSVDCQLFDAGDGLAGGIQKVCEGPKGGPWRYRINLNRNHSTTVKFATVAHELGHLFLGHLGADRALRILARDGLSVHQRELEAESVAYLMCRRHGVTPKSETYLAQCIDDDTTVENLDVWQLMRSAGRAEALMGLSQRDDQRLPSTAPDRRDDASIFGPA
jgi:hypothetical protein